MALLGLGPVSPAAWEQIVNATKSMHLKENENFIRTVGTVAFVTTGLLKEYDARQRKKPAIINFIQTQHFFLTRKHNQVNFIKACQPSLVYFMEWDDVANLYHQYRELKTIYDGLNELYDSNLAFRQRLLEEKVSNARISMFIQSHRIILPLLKKKDIANYLHLDYDHFVRQYSRLL